MHYTTATTKWPTHQPTSSTSGPVVSPGTTAISANARQRYHQEGFRPFRIGSLTGRLVQRSNGDQEQQHLQPVNCAEKEIEVVNHSLYPKKSDGIRPRTNCRFMNEFIAKQLPTTDREKLLLAFKTLMRNLPNIAQAEMWEPKATDVHQPIIPLFDTFESIREVYLNHNASLNVPLRDFIHYFLREYFILASKQDAHSGNILEGLAAHRETSNMIKPREEIVVSLDAMMFSRDEKGPCDLPSLVQHQ